MPLRNQQQLKLVHIFYSVESTHFVNSFLNSTSYMIFQMNKYFMQRVT